MSVPELQEHAGQVVDEARRRVVGDEPDGELASDPLGGRWVVGEVVQVSLQRRPAVAVAVLASLKPSTLTGSV